MASLLQWENVVNDDLKLHHVQDILQPIKDDLWVTAACADRILDDVDVQRALLDLGIARTDAAVERGKGAATYRSPPEPDDNEGDDKVHSTVHSEAEAQHESLIDHFSTHASDAQLCRLRTLLLERLDRLNTYVEMGQALLSKARGGTSSNDDDEFEDDPWADIQEEDLAEDRPTVLGTEPPFPLSIFLTHRLSFICFTLATQLQFEALKVVVQRHQRQLFPYRFSILQHVPVYANPADYRFLLPAVNTVSGKESIPLSSPWRDMSDWSETAVVKAALDVPGDLGLCSAEDADPNVDYPLHLRPLSADQVLTWYKDRVDHIISFGLIDAALGFVQHGTAQGVIDLDELGEELTLITRLVYDSPRPEGQDIDDSITLNEWRSMDASAIISRYLAYSTPDSIVVDIRRLVMPYLFVLESQCERAGMPDPKLATKLFYSYILMAPLAMIAPIFEASKPTIVASQRLISNDEDMVRLALACLYGNNSLDQWLLMSRIFECLPAWDFESDIEEDEADTTVASLGAFLAPSTSRPQCTPSDLFAFFTPLPAKSLSRALDILDVHLESGEILFRWSVPTPLRWFLQSAHDEVQQRAWATRLARQGRIHGQLLQTEDDWLFLMDDMLKLSRTGEGSVSSAFGLLSDKEIIRIFYSGILSSGNFVVARSLLNQQDDKIGFDPSDVEKLCLAHSREFYDNASSGNFNFGDMKLAYDCLSVASPSLAIQKEHEFIEATSRICSFNVMSRPGVPISPIEIRLIKDKLSLVSRVLSSNEDAYKHSEVILELMRKLGFRDDMVAEVKTLAMIADTALQAEDFIRAFEVIERMVDTVLRFKQSSPLGAENPKVGEAVEVCWVACYQLGRQPEFDDIGKKLTLLGRALELCPPENIADILAAWRKLELEDLEQRQEKMTIRKSRIPTKENGIRAGRVTTLAARLQGLHMPSPSLLSTPDAAALASQAFSRVAANFPFAVRGLTSEEGRDRIRSHSQPRSGSPDVQSQARHVLQRGLGWLIGADEEDA